MLEKWKVCPICEKVDRLYLESEETFEACKSKNDENRACLYIECRRCDLSLYDHTYEVTEYSGRVDILMKKWNSLPRWGETVTTTTVKVAPPKDADLPDGCEQTEIEVN